MNFDDPRIEEYARECQQGSITPVQLREKLTAFAVGDPDRLAFLKQKYAWVWERGNAKFI